MTATKQRPDTWIVGRVVSDDGTRWEFQGVFDEEQLAVAACIGPRYFVGPAKMNAALPDERHDWTGAYYPLTMDENTAEQGD
jgi:hypothetical protein